MRAVQRMFVLWGCLVWVTRLDAAAPEEPAKSPPDFRLEQRIPWTTSRIQGTPEPPSPYRTEVAFPRLRFHEPLAMAAIPGSRRLAIAERPGRILTFAAQDQVQAATVLLDLQRGVYGLAFHPQFARNGYFYVTSIVNPVEGTPDGSRLSRFQVTDRESWVADPSSETVILSWPSGGHNGGCIRFGNDGLLYLATGDGSGIADQLQTGQDLSDLLGAILRIDVDHPEPPRAYGIPADNPFRQQPDARPEIYSYGHRQVWKFSFDRQGRLWAGEVGQDLWEMIYLIQKGGNYGWSVQEGAHPFRPERPRGPTPIQPPLVEHSHNDFRSITGGYVYTGSRLPDLNEAYIYADYDTGRIWALRYHEQQVTDLKELADTPLRIVEFGQDEQGEVYLVDFAGGQLHRLARAPVTPEAGLPFPRKLSETGLFRSTRDMLPAPGLVPYSVNAELWSDGAGKERYLALPGDSRIGWEEVTYPQPAPGAEPGWRFPHDTVLVKSFFLPGATAEAPRRRLETRILHHKQMPGTEEYGDQYWRGYTYVWNDEQTDADLLEAGGLDREFTVHDPAAPGGVRRQTWHFPSRAECTLCHTMAAKYVLGVNTSQLNREHEYGGQRVNQLAAWNRLGLFSKPLPRAPEAMARLADYHDEREDLNLRARSYLQANCGHCHRKWGGGNAEFQLLAPLPLSETLTIDTRPGQGRFELPEPRILVPGAPDRSLLLYRMQLAGLGRMPHVASKVVDREAVALIRQWIDSLPAEGGSAVGWHPGQP